MLFLGKYDEWESTYFIIHQKESERRCVVVWQEREEGGSYYTNDSMKTNNPATHVYGIRASVTTSCTQGLMICEGVSYMSILKFIVLVLAAT